MCFDFLYNICPKHLILGRTELDMIKMYNSLRAKYPLFLSDLIKLEFYPRVFE